MLFIYTCIILNFLYQMRKVNKKYCLKNKGESGRQAILDHKSKTILLFLHICTCTCLLLNLRAHGFYVLWDHFFILELFPCYSPTSQHTVSGYQIEIKRIVLP